MVKMQLWNWATWCQWAERILNGQRSGSGTETSEERKVNGQKTGMVTRDPDPQGYVVMANRP